MSSNNDSNVTDQDAELDMGESLKSSKTGPFVIYGFLSFFIVIANSLVLLLIWRKRRLRTTSNFMLTSLAASDLLTGLLAVPMVIACSATYKPEVCIAMDISNRFLAFSSVGHLILLSVDRYIRVIKLLQYPSIVTDERVGWMLASVWIFALLASTIQLVWILSSFQNAMSETTLIRIELGFDCFCMAAIVLFPLVLMSVVYSKIFINLRRQSSEIHSELSSGRSSGRVNAGRRKVNEKKIASLFIAMIAIFIFGLFSYFLWAIMDDLEVIGYDLISPETMNSITIAILFLRFLTALCNPLLCTFIKQDFLDALKSFGRRVSHSRSSRNTNATTM